MPKTKNVSSSKLNSILDNMRGKGVTLDDFLVSYFDSDDHRVVRNRNAFFKLMGPAHCLQAWRRQTDDNRDIRLCLQSAVEFVLHHAEAELEYASADPMLKSTNVNVGSQVSAFKFNTVLRTLEIRAPTALMLLRGLFARKISDPDEASAAVAVAGSLALFSLNRSADPSKHARTILFYPRCVATIDNCPFESQFFNLLLDDSEAPV